MAGHVRRLMGGLAAALGAALVLPSFAAGDLASLKASCVARQAVDAPSVSFRLCDDGLPPAGGTNPNPGGVAAVEVPAAYRWPDPAPAGTADPTVDGLPPRDETASLQVPGNSGGNVALDIDVTLPAAPPPPGGYPLVVMMHGCCSGSKRSSEKDRLAPEDEAWRYNNAWFASRGYAVLTYTSRGFVDRENRGSTGETQLDSLQYEINDAQQLVGLLVDDPFFSIDPSRLVATGGSYGGGFSWLLFTDPIWRSPGGKQVRLAAVAPKYGWTDLVHTLVRTGEHFYDAGRPLPATDASESGVGPGERPGMPLRSIIPGLFLSGTTGVPPPSDHATFPPSVREAFTCSQTFWPPERNPTCATALSSVLPDFVKYRSAYYRNDFFARIAADPAYRVPVFSAGTLTDPLFPAVEHRRMVSRLRSVVPGYPVKELYGDWQHFTQNKTKQWADICGEDRHVCTTADYPQNDLSAPPAALKRTGVTTLLNRFLDFYAKPPANADEPAPSFDVTAQLQVCPQNATGDQRPDEPGPEVTAPSFDALTPGELVLDLRGEQTTVSDVEPNQHALRADPIVNQVGNSNRCPVETSPAGPGVATYDSPPLDRAATLIGGPLAAVTYRASSGDALQLNTRLYDVLPDGRAVLVDRGARRVLEPAGTVTYQLNGNAWRFEPGHRIRLEVTQDDDPYLKASNVPSSATVERVQLRLPVRESAFGAGGAGGGGARDRTAPTARMIAPRYASDVSTSASFPLRWTGSDTGSGVRSFRVEYRRTSAAATVAASRWRPLPGLSSTRRTTARLSGRPGETYELRVRARDRAGNVGRYATGETIVPTAEKPSGSRYAGPWFTPTLRGAFGGRVIGCSRRGCTATLRFRGGDLAIVGRRSPNSGRARVTLDGRSSTIDLYSTRTRRRQVVFARRLRDGLHKLTVRVLGTGRPAARDTIIAIDGYAVRRLRRR